MTIQDLLVVCKAYNDLGWAVQEQLTSLVNGEDLDEENYNPNAGNLIADWLGDVAANLDDLSHEAYGLMQRLDDADEQFKED